MVRTRGCQKCSHCWAHGTRQWELSPLKVADDRNKKINKESSNSSISSKKNWYIDFQGCWFNSCLYLGQIFCPNSRRFTLVSKLRSPNVKSGSQISLQKLHTPLKWYWPKNLQFKTRAVHFTTYIFIIVQEWGFGKANMCILVIEL